MMSVCSAGSAGRSMQEYWMHADRQTHRPRGNHTHAWIYVCAHCPEDAAVEDAPVISSCFAFFLPSFVQQALRNVPGAQAAW